jgi:hypothetical protein
MGTTFIIMMCAISCFFLVCALIYCNDNKDKRYVACDGREFYCWCEGAYSGSMCCVGIYEYFPKKLFKNRYRAYKTFWIDDYETINEGVVAMVKAYLKEEEKEKKNMEKWKNF